MRAVSSFLFIALPLASSAQEPLPPYEPSDIIAAIDWAPADTTIRRAEDGDNWPCTRADNGHLYFAYGDGWGSEPKVQRKRSLGLVRVEGHLPSICGVNVRSSSAERFGRGANGNKDRDAFEYFTRSNARGNSEWSQGIKQRGAVFHANEWDTGRGETSSFPTKWNSDDGRCTLSFPATTTFLCEEPG